MGNFVFLNLFLAILLDGFGNSTLLTENEETDNELKELDNLAQDKLKEEHLRIKKEKTEFKETQTIERSLYQQQCDEDCNQNGEHYEEDDDGNVVRIDQNLNANMIVQEGVENKYFHLVDVNMSMDSEDEIELKETLNRKFNKVAPKKDLYAEIHCENSVFCLGRRNKLRLLCAKLGSHEYFETVVLTVIVLSSLTLVIETYKTDYWPDTAVTIFNSTDYIFNALFIIEATIKIIHRGFVVCDKSYLRDSWSQLDFFIVCASIIDMTFTGVELTFIKVLRLLRTLRPLRFISHNRNMKIVVNALLNSVVAIMNVGIVILMVWIMFAILAISFMKDHMGYCDVDDYYGISLMTCRQMGGTWKVWPWNFDNIGNAFVTLFV